MRSLSDPPPLTPFRQAAFKSKLRVERIVVRFGLPLGTCVLICFLTGLFSHLQQEPVAWLPIPSAPVWLYRVSQGLHVATGIAAIPLIFFKLWTVYPNLFTWPAVKSAVHAFERLFVAVLVAAMLFQVATGLLNISQWYPWSFGFKQSHYAVAWALVGALAIHIGFKLPGIVRALRAPVPHDPPPTEKVIAEDGSQSEAPAQHIDNNAAYSAKDLLVTGGISRRGLFITAGTAVGAVTLVTVGQTFAPLQDTALLAPRVPDIGPQGIPVNKTAANANITAAKVGADYRLTIAGTREVVLTVDDLYDLQHVERELPIACVEGWSASGMWSGVTIATLMDLAGIDPEATVRVISLETTSSYGISELQPQFARNPLTILATRLRGEILDIEHGYPARIMAPNRPGVLQTKWVTRLEAV